MVDFYVKRIKKGQMTIDKVPPMWREETKKALEE